MFSYVAYLCPSLSAKHRPPTNLCPHPILCQLSDLRPRIANFLCLVLHWPLPRVSWSSSPSFPCWVPAQGVSCYICDWFCEGVSYPLPLLSYDVTHWFLLWSSPQFHIGNFIDPPTIMPSIHLKHLLMNVWTLVMVYFIFVLHVSKSYTCSSTDLTLKLKSCSLVWSVMLPNFQIFFIIRNALHSFCILAFTSLSVHVPPVLLTILPR